MNSNVPLAIIQRLKQAVPVSQSLEDVSLRIPSRIGHVQDTQALILRKNYLQQLPSLVQNCIGRFVPVANESWVTLFEKQLSTVTSLASDIDYLVHVAQERSDDFMAQLYVTIDLAIETREARDVAKKLLTPAYSLLEKSSELDGNSLEDRKKKIEAEFSVYGKVLESARLEDAASFDVSRIDFLQKNALFYMGLLASAKQVSTKTKQLCSTLDTLVDVYATIDPLAQTLHSLGDGVDTLKVHTTQLENTYQNALAATLRQNPADVVLPTVQEPIDRMVYTMLDSAERKFS
jgi:hypothetical protein